MPDDRYQVQFTWEGQTKFGIVEEFTAEAKAAKAAGELIIEDATRAVRYRVRDDAQVIDIRLGIPLYDRATNQVVPGNDYERHVAREFELVQQRSREAGPCLVPGKWFALLVGDGPAFYVVTKVGKKTARIEWRSFQADRWVDLHFGYGGTFPRSMIEQLIVANERLAPL